MDSSTKEDTQEYLKGDYYDWDDTEEDEKVNPVPEQFPANKPKPSGGAINSLHSLLLCLLLEHCLHN